MVMQATKALDKRGATLNNITNTAFGDKRWQIRGL
jgi:hypothetical protein